MTSTFQYTDAPLPVQIAIDRVRKEVRTSARLKPSLEYAQTYLESIPIAIHHGGEQGFKTQILYILGNLQAWRGLEARATKAILTHYATLEGSEDLS